MCFTSSDSAYDRQYEKSKEIDVELMRDAVKIKNTIRVLLLGPAESGKSTFLKQMKILHNNGFSDDEKRSAIEIIYDNVHESIFTLVANLRKHNILLDQPLSIRSLDFIYNIGAQRPCVLPFEYAAHVKILWRDGGIQRLYEKRNKFQLLDCAQYFLDKIDQIYSYSYVPSNEDILHARTITKGVHEINFPVKKGNYPYNMLMIDVGGQRSERSKWIQAFDGVKVVLYLSACSEFDQKLREDESENRFKESLKLFRSVWRNRFLRDAGIIVFLNKTDMLEEKMRKGKRISNYFQDYVQFENSSGGKPSNNTNVRYDIDTTKEYIKHKFRKIAVPFTLKGFTKGDNILVERECTLHFTTATNTENIKRVFADCQHIILMQNMSNWEFS